MSKKVKKLTEDKNTVNTDVIGWTSTEIQELFEYLISDDMSEPTLSMELRELYNMRNSKLLNAKTYYINLLKLQAEFIKLQDWVKHSKAKVLIILEGRDASGKGGVIKRITQRLNPRIARVVALNKPSEKEQTQWYFQRYVNELPSGGEIVLFDRSWYNRVGVERVMGFASDDEVEQFFQDVTAFEEMLVRSGIILLKYWFSITDEEQQWRFMMRIHDPLKQWKLSPMDLQSRVKWEEYTRAKEEMFERTSTPISPWYIVEGNDKRREHLNCMHHILSQIDYYEIDHDKVKLPERIYDEDYERRTLPTELYVPKIY